MEQNAQAQQNAAETDEMLRQLFHTLFENERQDWIWTYIRERLLYTANLAERNTQPNSRNLDSQPR